MLNYEHSNGIIHKRLKGYAKVNTIPENLKCLQTLHGYNNWTPGYT